MAHSIQTHLLRPGIDHRLIKLTGMGLADNGTKVVADRQSFALRKRLDVQFEVLRQEFANDDGTARQMSREHAVAKVR